MTNSIDEIKDANAIFAIGTNTTEAHPIIGQKVLQAKKKGASLIVADPRKIEIAEKADIWLQNLPGTNVALLNGMIKHILDNDLLDKEFIENHTEDLDELKDALKDFTVDKAAEITSVPKEKIEKAAELYAKSGKSTILYTMGITQFTTGTDGVSSVANLSMVTGNIGRESTGVNPLRGQNNVQGACDLGGLPVVYTGYQKVGDEKVTEKFSKAWGVELNDKPGLAVTEMMKAAGKDLKALYVMGENPMLTDANLGHVEEGLESLDFLVVQDIFLTETAEKADVVLPAASFAEKDGTNTNSERRVQRVRKAVEPVGDSKADWEIVMDLSNKMGYEMKYESAEDVMKEIQELTPSYKGISYERIENGGLQWPCPTEEHPGTKYLHKDGNFARGKGKFMPIQYKPSAESVDEEYPFLLTTGRILYHYHSVMTRKAKELNDEAPVGFIEINPEDAAKLGIENEDMVKVSSRRGEIPVPALVTDKVAPGVVFISFHYKEAAVNTLTNDAIDPKAKTPELKVAAVNIEKQ